MDEEMKKEHAAEVYNSLCAALDNRNWRYDKPDDLVIRFDVSGEDIPMEFVLVVDASRQLIRLMSKLPFVVPEDKRMDLAIATCVASDCLMDGSFDFGLQNGIIYFRMTASFLDSTIGEGLFNYMIDCSCATVDHFNDKFLAIAKGFMSISEFVAEAKS